MKNDSYFKFSLVLILTVGTLWGCQTPESSNANQGSQQQSQQDTNNNQANISTVETTYQNFKGEKTKFLEPLKVAVDKKEKYPSNTSKQFGEQLNKFKTEIENFSKKELDIKKENNNAKEPITKIKETLNEISDKLIKPLENGFNDKSVETVQKNLDIFNKQEPPIESKWYGFFGEVTYNEINNFLNEKQTEIESQIASLNQIVAPTGLPPSQDRVEQLSKEVKKVQEENSFFKRIAILSSIIATSSMIIALVALTKNRSISHNSWFSKIPLLNKFNNHQEEPPSPEISQEDTSNSFSLSQSEYMQIYNQVYNSIYNQLYQPFKEKIENIDRQVDNRINRNRTIQELEERIGKLERGKKHQHASSSSSLRNDTQPKSLTPSQPRQNLYQEQPQIQSSQTTNALPSSSTNTIKTIEVSETEKSATDRRLGKSQTVILEKKRRGNYLVYHYQGYDCLAPSENLRINEFNYKTVEAVFECRNYNPNDTTDFQVVQPALVNIITNGEMWELQQRGILQF